MLHSKSRTHEPDGNEKSWIGTNGTKNRRRLNSNENTNTMIEETHDGADRTPWTEQQTKCEYSLWSRLAHSLCSFLVDCGRCNASRTLYIDFCQWTIHAVQTNNWNYYFNESEELDDFYRLRKETHEPKLWTRFELWLQWEWRTQSRKETDELIIEFQTSLQ